MIGLSVSFCIKDIIDGKMKEADVEKISAGTCCHDMNAWQKVSNNYQESYWYKNPSLGHGILFRLIEAGKIDQPRTRGEWPVHYSPGKHWRDEPVDAYLLY